VFLTVGRLSLPAFAAAPHHLYVIRSIDKPDGLKELLPRHHLILERGPFALGDELALMEAEGVEVVVTKNSGGQATSAKLAAARQLGLPVILIERPRKTEGREAHDVEAALAWIADQRPAP
jgi:precorrin-6A/cobalt-precorrin-6A reductase